MHLFSWLRKWTTEGPQTRRALKRKPAPRFRPNLEVLEGRIVPSTLTVTSAADSGAGSLRAEIAAAQPKDTIVFAPSLNGQTITLTSGELVINKSLTIQGPGADQLTISGGPGSHSRFGLILGPNNSRVFDVYGPTTNATLSGLTITHGNGRGGLEAAGGAILNSDGSTLTVSGCTVSDSRDIDGGGIANYLATLNIVNSTLSGNIANVMNGGLGGAVYSVAGGGKVSMTDCILSNNQASGYGGAVWMYNTAMTIDGCTLSGNIEGNYTGGAYTPAYGNDIHNNNIGPDLLTVKDSVFSNNTPDRFVPIEGAWVNGGGNTGV